MSTYRTGNHHGVTIVREGDGSRCGRPEHDCDRGHLVAVVVDGGQELAERICTLLNGAEDVEAEIVGDPARTVECKLVRYAGPGPTDPCGCFAWEHCAMAASDSCTCPLPLAADPACPVHEGRKARAPRPPYLGPGCICDGSGRTCPRHGVVL